MPSNRTASLTALQEKRRKLEADIAAKKQALATAIGTPFVTQFGDGFSAKEASKLATAVAKIGVEQALNRLT